MQKPRRGFLATLVACHCGVPELWKAQDKGGIIRPSENLVQGWASGSPPNSPSPARYPLSQALVPRCSRGTARPCATPTVRHPVVGPNLSQTGQVQTEMWDQRKRGGPRPGEAPRVANAYLALRGEAARHFLLRYEHFPKY